MMVIFFDSLDIALEKLRFQTRYIIWQQQHITL